MSTITAAMRKAVPLPDDDELVVRANAAVQVVCGTMLALGRGVEQLARNTERADRAGADRLHLGDRALSDRFLHSLMFNPGIGRCPTNHDREEPSTELSPDP